VAGEVTRVRVRPAIRRLALWTVPTLLLIAAWQTWDAVETGRLERELARVREDKPDPDATVQALKDDAARYYAAAAMATVSHIPSRSRTLQLSPGGPLVDAIEARRDLLSRGLAEPAPLVDALRQIERDPVVVDLLARASGLPFERFAPGTEFNYLWSGSLSVARSAGLRTLDLIAEGNGDAATTLLFDRVKQLRAFDRRNNALDAVTKAQSAGKIAVDVGILVAHTRPSDTRLTDLEGALAGAFSTDELALSIRGPALSFSGTISGLWRRTWPGVLLRPLFRHHLVAYLQTMADAMEAARLRWPDRIKAMEQIPERRSVLPEWPRFIWSSREIDLLRNQTVVLGEGVAAVHCARLVIKIEQFRRANDRLPATLSELKVPSGDDVALDPFTGNPLLYTRGDDEYIVYSVGKNLRDDGGTLSPKPQAGAVPSALPALDVGVRVVLRRQ
jgi:hypothetical protein